MSLSLAFDNTYARLPARLYERQHPVAVAAPALLALNVALARDMGLDPTALSSPEGVAMLSGNLVPEGADPLAQAYAGHQFGRWVPQLGDGRALLLGEVCAPDGRHWDIHLKGAGRTAFSRGGDGRAWLGPVLREYLVSEAMAALGVPTTRALAATATGETVWREAAYPGAILTRVAPSHLRVGTFQACAARGDTDALRALADFAIARHYPDASDALGLLRAVVAAQADLIARWMGLGFIHGVMNTDNAHVGGLTIDYGPCAFLDDFHPDQVFSSIDRGGRYAYGNQPQMAVWNVAQLATALLDLIDPDRDRALALATDAVHAFAPAYQLAWRRVFAAKIGLAHPQDDDDALIGALLSAMATHGLDFTQTFRALAEDTPLPPALDGWQADWRARLAADGLRTETARAVMRLVNPAIIARNHRIEEVIAAALDADMAPFARLHAALAHPFDPAPDHDALRTPPHADERVHATFCGT